MGSIEQGDVAAANFAEMRTETSEDHDGEWQFNWPAGTRRTIIARDAGTGGSTFLLELPGGYYRPPERERSQAGEKRFEWHSCHEEIFCLRGAVQFGGFYAMTAPGYLNHPPYWVHPADQYTPTATTLLIKNSGPVDFRYVPIPEDWNGTEYCDVSGGSATEDPHGVTSLSLETQPWRSDGHLRRRPLYQFPDGLRTELLQLPPGWTGAHQPHHRREALFVLDGSVTVDNKELARWGYCSGTEMQLQHASAADGATLIRWMK